MAFGDDAVLNAQASGGVVTLVITASDLAEVTVWRMQPGFSDVVVRGALESSATGVGLWSGGDFEAPPGVALSYRASIVSDTSETASIAPVAAVGVVDHGGDWVSPVGQPALGLRVHVEAGGLSEVVREVTRDVQVVLNRPAPVAVSFGRRFISADLTLITLTDEERRAMLGVIEWPVVMFVARPGMGIDQPIYASLGDVREIRPSPLGAEPARRWVLQVTQVDRPPAGWPYTIIGTTWSEIEANYGSWQDVLDVFPSWYDVAGYPS